MPGPCHARRNLVDIDTDFDTDFDFDTVIDRTGTWSVQWDGVADRFGAAAAHGMLPFTISDMDFASPPVVLDALHRRIAHGVLGYTDWRNEDFLSAVRLWFATRYDTAIDTDRLVYAPSVLNQLSQLLRMWTGPGDGVVVHTPTYDGFLKAIAGLGRELRGAPVGDTAALERQLARPGSKVLLLCSPHNPTGRVWTEGELTEFARLAEVYGVAVISDEIHADFLHVGGVRHLPWTRFGTGRWALITSGSKAFNFPALSGSYGLVGDPGDHAAFVRRMATGEGLESPAVLALIAHIAAYREGGPWLDALNTYVGQNLLLVAERLNSAFPQLDWRPPEAGYLAWIDLRPLGIDDDALQRELVEVEKVAIMRGSTYGAGGDGFVRLNVGCPRAKAERGVDALIRALGRLAS
ncbi:aminotransferase class I/II-fold pyridoxal phosphate-dependent enzyme [Streptomyces liangshanensis]|uniref:cysteine-S-conjugate beta-lyase n=1 Tax=Streptomyces liangshanensis TaxID=2717324 RepID=A0A6G9GZ61_9ACTN|nr:aminotransferase class I/II-fold pyridoxal phosphate-dependent enzyme [Streptomyces liangshanensis]